MKKALIFIGGIVTGALLIIAIAMLVGRSSSYGITFFEEEGECMKGNSFEVFQVLDSGNALAWEFELKQITQNYSSSSRTGLIVLFLGEEGQYYDDQVIEIPPGKCAKQIGVYKYNSNSGWKTVPVVSIRSN